MTRPHISRRARAALCAALAVGVIAPVAAGAAPAGAATPTTSCTSGKAGLASKLSKDITAALKGRKSTTAVALYDRTTKTTCTLRATSKYDSASVVKATVLATLLWDNAKTGRYLTQRETDLSTAMITKSDNDATTALWKQLGATKVSAFLKAAGMTHTVPGSGGYWGLTQITAQDEQRLLTLLTAKNSVLSDGARAYELGLMRKVVSSQRWGTPAGAPGSATVQVKNGWLQRATHGWRVHSIGAFTGEGHDYVLTVLTQDNATMNTGVDTIQAVARAVHKDLNPRYMNHMDPVVPGTLQEAIPPVPEAPAGRMLSVPRS
ncbi:MULTISPECIES: serine hydrolase [unclassified Streptomyces]|uniref:serine hydrolase n=1 Tax=unclassified Streptomyces TaxID=2593676 RepID=UPI0022597765|nr:MULTISPECIES: serine hydrolase [unclassified Streptomyces]MCX5140377.1 class A beta-lactamase-related serine hydrolase [Streptomyces sp. NBC_00338]WRZ64931.1 class A beta-lactamase-related serine hydrolase [Streptomyces sp. NBC_01257]WSU58930.1 class A beta-lactamase-related serine hydrolase [Streptomyces sp. NBC_01104]